MVGQFRNVTMLENLCFSAKLLLCCAKITESSLQLYMTSNINN